MFENMDECLFVSSKVKSRFILNVDLFSLQTPSALVAVGAGAGDGLRGRVGDKHRELGGRGGPVRGGVRGARGRGGAPPRRREDRDRVQRDQAAFPDRETQHG